MANQPSTQVANVVGITHIDYEIASKSINGFRIVGRDTNSGATRNGVYDIIITKSGTDALQARLENRLMG